MRQSFFVGLYKLRDYKVINKISQSKKSDYPGVYRTTCPCQLPIFRTGGCAVPEES